MRITDSTIYLTDIGAAPASPAVTYPFASFTEYAQAVGCIYVNGARRFDYDRFVEWPDDPAEGLPYFRHFTAAIPQEG